MAQLQNTVEEVLYIGKVISANNPSGLASALRAEGINVPSGYTESSLVDILFSVFQSDKAKWVRVVKAVPFNNMANNWTTSSEIISAANSIPGVDTSNQKFLGIDWGKVGDFIGGSTTTGGGVKTTGNAGASAVALLAVAVVAGVIIWKLA